MAGQKIQMFKDAKDAQDALTKAVVERLSRSHDRRFNQLMVALVTKLHEFIRQVELSPDEWMTAIEFLTATGQTCTDKRQEFILLSDTLGASMMVVMQDRAAYKPKGKLLATDATEATVTGPFYWPGAPEMPLGSNIAEGVKGEPTFYSGRVTDIHGTAIAGAVIDVWSGDGEGTYDMQVEGAPMAARARLMTDAEGRYQFWSIRPSYYPIPTDGPVGRMLTRAGAHPNRPAHIHFKVSAPNHIEVITHLFVANSPYLKFRSGFRSPRPSHCRIQAT